MRALRRVAVGADPSKVSIRGLAQIGNLREVYARACAELCAQLHSAALRVRISSNSFPEVPRPTPAAELTKVTGALRLRFRASLVSLRTVHIKGFGQ